MATLYPLNILTSGVRTLPTKQGGQSADDIIDGGSASGSYVTFGVATGPVVWSEAGFRFPNCGLPAGATIVSASLRFKTYSGGTQTTALDVYIAGDLHADAAIWSGTSDIQTGSPQFRLRTNELVHWSFAAGAENWSQNTWYSSPDISPIVQEILDLAGDMTSKAIAFTIMMRDPAATPPYSPITSGSPTNPAKRTVYAWDYGDHTSGAEFHCTYTLPVSDEIYVLKTTT